MKIKRVGTYLTGFKYYNYNNEEIIDDIKITNIKKLKIPPCYNNVVILNNKKIPFICQKKFLNCKNKQQLPFDFYITNLNIGN